MPEGGGEIEDDEQLSLAPAVDELQQRERATAHSQEIDYEKLRSRSELRRLSTKDGRQASKQESGLTRFHREIAFFFLHTEDRVVTSRNMHKIYA